MSDLNEALDVRFDRCHPEPEHQGQPALGKKPTAHVRRLYGKGADERSDRKKTLNETTQKVLEDNKLYA